MKIVEVRTQAELDAALAAHDNGHTARIVIIGDDRFVTRGQSHVEAWGQSHVEAWGQSHVEAWGQSHVEAWEQSHVVAWEQSHVVAWGQSHVVAREQSHVEAWGAVQVRAFARAVVLALTATVVVSVHGCDVKVEGSGIVVKILPITTPEGWCDHYGAKIQDGIATLYKIVSEDFRSAHGVEYRPGLQPEAPDWDGGEAECGGGLHFCAHPLMTLSFWSGDHEKVRFVACPVALSDMRAPRETDGNPTKIKARRVCGPIVEVDRYGVAVATIGGAP